MKKTNELVFSNYKEPLKPIEKNKGYGYYGAILMDKQGEKIQCHLCGLMFKSVGTHIFAAHGLRADDYRTKFELARATSLVSEVERQRLKANGLHCWEMKTAAQKKAFVDAGNKFGKSRKGVLHRLETKNKRGNCPDQLIDKIKKFADETGKKPNLRAFRKKMNEERHGGVILAIYQTFGSWNAAVKIAGHTPTPVRKCPFTNQELLDMLRVYYKRTKKVPTKSDSARGFIPSAQYYRNRFGSLPKARRLVNIPSVSRGILSLQTVRHYAK